MSGTESERNSGALLDFLELYQADRTAGIVRTREEYEARFPGFESSVAGELARQEQRRPEPGSASGDAQDPFTLLERLKEKRAAPGRYRRGPEIGRGASSRVYLAHDVELDREVAMKVFDAPRAAVLPRFVREARVIGRLDHPGIVPVHDLGLDADGRVFFTMRLIRGKSLKQVLEEERSRATPSFRRRFLEIVARICDTLAFAHARGVVHRDVKPSNVMVGAFGEVYLVDWGLARLAGDGHDGAGEPAEAPPVETLAGQVLGTPAYMPPEQARASSEAVGPRSDVYAVGSILYHFLAGHAPFCDGDTPPSSGEVLERVAAGPPPPLTADVRAAEPELSSIAARAMARDPRDRYDGGSALAEDLRAFLDGRAVQAHGSGWSYRTAKWLRRNRGFAIGLGVTLLLGLVSVWSAREAHARNADLRLLADLRAPGRLMDELDLVWPAVPERKEALAAWIRQAEDLRARAHEYELALDRLRETHERLPVAAHEQEVYARRREQQIATALSAISETKGELEARERGETDEGPPIEKLRFNMGSLERWLKAFRARPLAPEPHDFADAEVQLLHDRLEQFLVEVEIVVGREEPRERLLLARAALELAERADAEAGVVSWEEARAGVRASSHYAGMELAPQRSLVPLGPDPASGLWEFAHAQSGRVPVRGADGRLAIDGESAIVLVLVPVPGGVAEVGAQAADPEERLYDPYADSSDGPRIEPKLAPFFLSKFELTLGQWCRMTGRPPDYYFAVMGEEYRTLDMPAIGICGEWAQNALAAYGLELPTSIGWEHAARAGSRTIWWCGNDVRSLEGCGNVADEGWKRASNARKADVAGAVPFDDGYVGTSPIGSFRANAWGLYDTIGNVAELCRDVTVPRMDQYLPDTAQLATQPTGLQILRGGHCAEGAVAARSAAREYVQPTHGPWYGGIRPSRRVAPGE